MSEKYWHVTSQEFLECMSIQLTCPEGSPNADYSHSSSSISFIPYVSSAEKMTLQLGAIEVVENREKKQVFGILWSVWNIEQAGHHIKWLVHEEGLPPQDWWIIPPIHRVQAS